MYNTPEMATDELIRRALSAYWRDGDMQPSDTAIRKVGGKKYVVIKKGARLLACYRVRNDGKLKRLVRVPPQLV